MIAPKAQNMPAKADRVRLLQRKLYATAKANPKRRFGILYDKLYRKDVLQAAWEKVKANRGSAGVDGQTIEQIEAQGVGSLLEEVRVELEAERYQPKPVRRVAIPKPGRPGQTRPLGVPTVKDRIVQAAAKIVIEPILEANFLDCSYGFRPKRSAQQAHAAVQKAVTGGYRQVVDLDLRSYYDTIPQERLMRVIRKRIADPKMLRLIWRWLKAGVMTKEGYQETTVGTPQGSVISPLLSNAYLHVIDKIWVERYPETRLVRFADDAVVMCKQKAEYYLAQLKALLEWHGLQVHPEKTRVVQAEEGFDFLGQHFRLKPSRKWKGWRFCYRWPSHKSMRQVKEKIRSVIGKDDIHSLETKIAVVNPVIRGWCNFHRYSNAHKHFSVIDGYVYERLVRFLRQKHRWRSQGYREVSQKQLEDQGLFHLHGQIRRWPLNAGA